MHNFTDIFYDSTNHIFCQIEKFFCPIKTLVLRPVKENTSGEFAEQILADLIRQGYSGEELLEKFKQAQRKVRPAASPAFVPVQYNILLPDTHIYHAI